MHLSPAAADRFYDLLNSLLLFANAYYDVMDPEELLLPDGALDPHQCLEVLGRLWEDPGIIDEYVEQNPLGLPPRDLAQAHRWKHCVTGPALLLGYDGRGRALFLVGERRVAVQGITQDFAEVAPEKPPVVLGVTLLPFDNVVIYDSLVQALPVNFGPGMQEMIEREAAEAESWPIVETADEFVELARQVNKEREQEDWERFQRQMDRERWERDGSEPMVPGVHRGALVGLSEEEREARIQEELRRVREDEGEKPLSATDILKKRADHAAPASSLAGCLACDKKALLEEDARKLGIKGFSSLRKAQLAERLAREWVEDPKILQNTLLTCFDAEFKSFCQLLEAPGGRLVFAEKDAEEHRCLIPCPPLSRLFWHDGVFTALVPDELREQVGALDLDGLRRRRLTVSRVGRLAEVLVELCGIVPVRELPERYEAFYGEKIDLLDVVDSLLIVGRRESDDAPFELWLNREEDGYEDARDGDVAQYAYVIHYSVGDEEVAGAVSSRLLRGMDEQKRRSREAVDKLIDQLERDMPRELARRDDYLRDLLAAHAERAEAGSCPLDPALAEEDVFVWKTNLPEAVNLRNWLDAHVPDDENDCFYAEGIIEELLDVQLGEPNPKVVVQAASDMGLFEISEDFEGLMGRLMAFVNALPSWWNNGWAPEALFERETGRKIFRNPDGSPMKVGRNDPCPCGSGKKYKKCCGR